MQVIKTFGDKGKMMIGHCAGAMMFDFTGITKGKKVAVHPLAFLVFFFGFVFVLFCFVASPPINVEGKETDENPDGQ